MGNLTNSITHTKYNVFEAVIALNLAFSEAGGKSVNVDLSKLGLTGTGTNADPFSQLAVDGFTGTTMPTSILDESTGATAVMAYNWIYAQLDNLYNAGNGYQLDILPVTGKTPISPSQIPSVVSPIYLYAPDAAADIRQTASNYTLNIAGLSGITIDGVQLAGTDNSVSVTSGGNLIWTGTDGTQYQFTPAGDFSESGIGTLLISGGAIATATGGDSVSIDDFNLPAAQAAAGFAGIHLDSDIVAISFGSSDIAIPLRQSSATGPNFAAGTSQSYTVTVGTPSSAAQVVNITLSDKVDTFPFQRYGSLQGTLVSISPDAEDKNAAARDTDTRAGAASSQNADPTHDPAATPNTGYVYKIRIHTEDSHFVVDGEPRPVLSGMTVQADITTDRRRVIDFFLSPVVKYLDEGMKVR